MKPDPSPRWDFFLAHAGPDLATAETLYSLLAGRSRVFLDSRCLRLGDDWDLELTSAQHSSRITVVLVSSSADRAYYQREEIAAAIALARTEGGGHRVVPLYLPGAGGSTVAVPYGLRLKHGITMAHEAELSSVAAKLLFLLASLPPADGATAVPARSVKEQISDLLSGLSANCPKARALQIEDELFRLVRNDVQQFLDNADQFVAPAREAIAVVGGRLLHSGINDQRIADLLRRLTKDPDKWVRKKANDGLMLAGY